MKAVKVFLVLSVLTLAVSQLFASGSSAGSSAGSGAPTPISIFSAADGRDNWIPSQANNQEIMRRTNTIITWTHNNTASGRDTLNLLFASGDLPDVIGFPGVDFQQYISFGYLRPLDDLLKTHGQNILQNTSQDVWKMMTIQGKIYAYPYENNRIKQYTYARLDWLNNLKIDLSRNQNYGNFGGKVVTLNEFRDILVKFTRNDPDGNGRNDTYGIGGRGTKTNWGWWNIYGAFGGMPGHYYIADGKATPWAVTDQYRQGIQYINSLWRDGLIDPEVYLHTDDQSRQKMINGVSGVGTGEWWSTAYETQYLMRDIAPQAEFIPLLISSNDGKIMGAPDNGLLSTSFSITTKSKNPEKVMDFLNFLNSDEGWYLNWQGVEGVDYNMVGGFPIRTEVGTAKSTNVTLDTMFPLSNRLSLANNLSRGPKQTLDLILRQKWEILQQDNSQPTYTSAFYGLPNPTALNELGVDVNNWIEQSAMAFITGETPLTDANWNNYINTWKRMGGVKILQGYIDEYNRVQGTRITAGITE
jgi:putative aldouronate transport system substrate-binding protein